MHKKIQKTLNEHEREFPGNRELNDLSVKDILSLDKIRPSKPLSMHAAYGLDGHHHNRPVYGGNYDHLLRDEEKDAIDKEVVEASELAAMIHDPEFIDDLTNHKPSKNQKISREILHHYLDTHGPIESQKHLEKELIDPLFENLRDRLKEEGIIDMLLSEKMSYSTPHSPKDYARMIKSMLLDPVYEGHKKKNWEKNLLKIFNTRRHND